MSILLYHKSRSETTYRGNYSLLQFVDSVQSPFSCALQLKICSVSMEVQFLCSETARHITGAR